MSDILYCCTCLNRKIAFCVGDRDGYWIREFPEGLVMKEFANGRVSIEPGQSPRPSMPRRILNKIYGVGTSY